MEALILFQRDILRHWAIEFMVEKKKFVLNVRSQSFEKKDYQEDQFIFVHNVKKRKINLGTNLEMVCLETEAKDNIMIKSTLRILFVISVPIITVLIFLMMTISNIGVFKIIKTLVNIIDNLYNMLIFNKLIKSKITKQILAITIPSVIVFVIVRLIHF